MRTTTPDYNCQLLRSLITMKLNTLIRPVPRQGVGPADRAAAPSFPLNPLSPPQSPILQNFHLNK